MALMYADLEQLERIIVKSLSNLHKSLYLENIYVFAKGTSNTNEALFN
jgi:hypothetical protein